MTVAWRTMTRRKEKYWLTWNWVPDCGCSIEGVKYEHWRKFLAHVHWADKWERVHYLDYPANSGDWTETMMRVNDSWAD
jgi:hypothetical protein